MEPHGLASVVPFIARLRLRLRRGIRQVPGVPSRRNKICILIRTYIRGLLRRRMTLLKGKTILITGAGKGLGRALAKSFAAQEASLLLLTRSQKDLNELKKDLDPKTILLSTPGDVSNERDVNKFFECLKRKTSVLDCLINNAGFLSKKSPLHHVPTSDWDQSMAVNLRGPFLMIKYALPLMLAQKKGSIINVSSGVGKKAAPLWGPYSVSKWGLEGLTQLVAEEVASSGVRVNAVNPGGLRTRMREEAFPKEDPKTLPTPESVVELFHWLASDESASVTGHSIEGKEWKSKYLG